MDDDAPEMRDIEAFVDLRLIWDLEVVLPGLSVERLAAEIQAEFMVIVLKIADIRLQLHVMVAAVTHVADIVELRAGHHLFQVREKDVLMTLRVARIAEKITINNVF